MKLNELTAVDASRLIKNHDITSEELVQACFERIDERDHAVKAWEYLDREMTLEQARSSNRSTNRGLLHGIPVGVKDIMDTSDMPACYGSSIYSGHRPKADASCVALIRKAGGIVLGKTVTTEFAVLHPGKTTNPHNVDHTPGGSSSGSAAAVADFMVPLALGTQTAGSVIRPASFCGVVGFKPTFGWINRAGIKPCSESLDTVGIFARNVEDAALLATVLTRRSLVLVKPLNVPPRIGLCHTYEWSNAATETVNAFERAKEQLENFGAKVEETNLPTPFSKLANAQTTIMNFEMARSFEYEYSTHRDQLSNKLIEMIAQGEATSPAAYDAAVSLAVECRSILKQVFANVNFLIAPSAIGEAPEGLTSTGDPIFNRIWTILHVPCINIPVYMSPRKLPVGLQMLGPIGSDANLLEGANWTFKHLSDIKNA